MSNIEKPKEIADYNCSPYIAFPDQYTKNAVKLLFENLFQEIKHGDQGHQDWLENEIKGFVARNVT